MAWAHMLMSAPMMANPFEFREQMRAMVWDGVMPSAAKGDRPSADGETPPSLTGKVPASALAEARRLHQQIVDGNLPDG